MKTKYILIFTFVLNLFSISAQELALVRENGVFGYINTSGEYVIEPQFEVAKNFSGNLAAASQDKKWGFIDTSGKWAIQPEYDKVKAFHAGFALVLKGKQWSYIDSSNKTLTTPVQEKYYDFNDDGIAFFRVEKKLGLLGTDGKLIIEPTYDVIKPFVDGYARVRNGENWGMIDKKGTVTIPLEYSGIGSYNSTGIWAKKGETFGIISNGEFNMVSGVDKIWDFNDKSNLTYARSNKKVGFIDNKGKWVIEPQYAKVRSFSNGLAPVLKGKSWGYINTKGEEVTGFIYKDAEIFSADGLAPVKSKKLWGFIDKTGKLVIPEKYEITAGGFSIFTKNNLKGFKNGLARVKLDKKWAFLNVKGEALGNKWYQNVELFVNTNQ
ncbi:WG repeat-containing protein [Flavivirga aquimarina]|uniref:WG repeat-containing protein n=1 Tax=Flavivirga aquimarina TaxID=2027862 RepID=A0ABT8WFE7_9FLAO|nr:WG repeat-containing protein [Flavivirga aquimarina]MDO5971726.1 WG repeat-containing protein [Flavivirga aquimarina]